MIATLLNTAGAVLGVLVIAMLATADTLLWLCDRPSQAESSTSRAQRAAQAVRARHATSLVPGTPDPEDHLAVSRYNASTSGSQPCGVTP